LKPRAGKPFAAVWDLATPACVPLPAGMGVLSHSFAADGKRLALVGPNHYSAIVCDPATGKVVAGPFRQAATRTTSDIVVRVALSPDGTRLAVGNYNHRFHLWDVAGGKCLAVGLPGKNVFFSRGGKRVVGSGLWDAATGKTEGAGPFSGSSLVAAVLAGREGETLVGVSKLDVRVWDSRGPPLSPWLRVPVQGLDLCGWAFAERGYCRAELGRWQEARDDYRVALERQPTQPQWNTYHALTLMALGNEAAVTEAVGPRGVAWRQHWRLGPGFDPNPWAANETADTTSLTPHGDHAAALALIELALKERPKEYAFLNTHGLVLYRLGRYAEARDRLDEAIKAHPKGAQVGDLLLLAMVHHALKEPEKARRRLTEAERILDRSDRPSHAGGKLLWPERLEAEIWLREARALVKGP
jgi:tetratricopeptide (TPR) repeat protein